MGSNFRNTPFHSEEENQGKIGQLSNFTREHHPKSSFLHLFFLDTSNSIGQKKKNPLSLSLTNNHATIYSACDMSGDHEIAQSQLQFIPQVYKKQD